jgi:hypothetical protein
MLQMLPELLLSVGGVCATVGASLAVARCWRPAAVLGLGGLGAVVLGFIAL